MNRRLIVIAFSGDLGPESTADFRAAGRTAGRTSGSLAGRLRSYRIGESVLFGSSVFDFDADCKGTKGVEKNTNSGCLWYIIQQTCIYQ